MAWEIAGFNISALLLPHTGLKSTGSSRQKPPHSTGGEQSAASPVGAVSSDTGKGTVVYLLPLKTVSEFNFGMSPCGGMGAAMLYDEFPGKICDFILNAGRF